VVADSQAFMFASPRPLNGARAEHERAARRLVERQVMVAVWPLAVLSVVLECLHTADGRRGQVELPAGRKPLSRSSSHS